MNDLNYHCTMVLAGINVPSSFRFSDTAACFGRWITGPADAQGSCSVSASDWDLWLRTGKPTDAFAEYSLFSSAASTALLPHRRCVIHAAAFRYDDRAWLISAGSGVGKSTQIRTLQELYPGKFTVISGDRPILEAREDGGVIVHPSPWNGKEGWHGAEAAPLAGTILLRRGDENAIAPCKKQDVVVPVLMSIIQSSETVEIIKQTASMAEAILESAPVWEMTTYSIPDSTRLMCQALFGLQEF